MSQETEQLGEALFALSAQLKASGFLADDAHHAVYERVVQRFAALTSAPTAPDDQVERLREALMPFSRIGVLDGRLTGLDPDQMREAVAKARQALGVPKMLISQEWLDAKLSSDPTEEVEARSRCEVPPTGWWCSREPGHEGPCAARPTAPVDRVDGLREAWHKAVRNADLKRGEVVLHASDWMGLRDAIEAALDRHLALPGMMRGEAK